MNTKLKELRIKAGYKNAKEFVAKTDCPYSTYLRYEAGYNVPKLKDAAVFAKLLNCSLSDLVDDVDMSEDEVVYDPSRNELTQIYSQLNTHDQSVLLNLARLMNENSGNQTNIANSPITGSAVITGDNNTVDNSGSDYSNNSQNITINNYNINEEEDSS